MSKKYQYLAKKRGSTEYLNATYISGCKIGCPNHYTTCKVCLFPTRIGKTRRLQQQYQSEISQK